MEEVLILKLKGRKFKGFLTHPCTTFHSSKTIFKLNESIGLIKNSTCQYKNRLQYATSFSYLQSLGLVILHGKKYHEFPTLVYARECESYCSLSLSTYVLNS